VDFAAVERARTLLREYFPPSRLVPAPSLSAASGAEIRLKLESELPTGSFKVRGALATLYARRERGALAGVVTASTGNHGAGISWAARRMGIPAAIFLPQNPNPAKRERIAALGAEIVEAGRDLDESRTYAAKFAAGCGWPLIVDGQDPLMLPGTATIACEILDEWPETEVIFVPVGDSTLIRGLAFAAKHLAPRVRIVGAQAERAPAYFRSWKECRVVTTEACDTIADGLATRCPVEENVHEMRALVDEMRLVSEEELLGAVWRLLAEEHVVAEPAGAAATAALVQSGRELAGRNVVLLVTGANIPPATLREAALRSST